MESGIYVIRNINNGKVYVGSTKNFAKREKRHFRDLLLGTHSSIKFQRSYNKHGKDAFVFEIIEEALYERPIKDLENDYIKKFNAKKHGYNIADASFGDMLSTHPLRAEIIKKMSETVKLNMSLLSKDEKNKKFAQYGEKNGMFGKKRSTDEMANCFEANRVFFEEHGHGRSKGRKASDVERKRLSDDAKLRTGCKNSFFGKSHSAETKEKMSNLKKGQKCPTLHPFFVDGIRYERLKDAAEATGIKSPTIWYRCNSKNLKFKTYYFEDTPK